jgi:hypothetical protein
MWEVTPIKPEVTESEASPHFRECPKLLRIFAAPLICKPLKSLGFVEMRGWFSADAANAPRGKPFLVSTDKLSGPARDKLERFLDKHAPGTQFIQVEEEKILEKTKQLRAALRLPEDLSGGAP